MILLKDLDYKEIITGINNLKKWKDTYSEIFKVVQTIKDKSEQLRKENKDNDDFISAMNFMKSKYNIKYEHEFIDFFIKFFTSEIRVSDTIILNLDNEAKNPKLEYDLSFKFTLDISTNEKKINAINFNLRNFGFLSDDYLNKLNSEVFVKFENTLLNNPDLTNWFFDFINEISYNFHIQMEQLAKSLEYLNIVYNNLTEEKKIELYEEKKKYENIIVNLNSKIVKPKAYDKENLAEYYFKVALLKKSKPSLRDLEKGSDWNKDKWNKHLNTDYKLIGNIFMKLQEEKNKNTKLENEEWFLNLFSEYQIKFSNKQLEESKNQKKSTAIEYNDNISNENY